MTEKTATKIMQGFQIGLATLMLVLMSISFGYHLIAGNLRLFPFCCFMALWVISYKMFRWSISEYKEEIAKF